MVRTGRPGLDVAGLAVAAEAAVIPAHAALAALHDARVPVAAVTAVLHVGHSDGESVSGTVRDVVGAAGCLRTFDVDPRAGGFVAALAVGASLLGDGDREHHGISGAVLITACEPGSGAASIVLTRGSPSGAGVSGIGQASSDTIAPCVLRSASPVRGLLDCRAAGRYDVVLVAADRTSPRTASVRCRLQHWR
ncbi:hypothetical protein [Gordonia sp. (in: high G+C Gram-positive bacteria)]|uniref:hypothetical protein n=1 Tax=Gordonia sp. (in: high G+C Gram-positive bacteria) TaxID=84139 RepID=UPI003F95CDCB